jgi:hypothetical protein
MEEFNHLGRREASRSTFWKELSRFVSPDRLNARPTALIRLSQARTMATRRPARPPILAEINIA